MTNLLDAYLLFRIRVQHDPGAYAELYDRYVTSIYRFVFLKVPTKEQAEDITSETFLRGWLFLQEAKEPVKNVRALLYRMARNLIADLYRKDQDRLVPLARVTFLDDETSTTSTTELSDEARGRALIEARADIALVLDKIARLKADYQDVLTLRLIDGLGYTDIGAILEKPAGHVRVIYHRAMKALLALLDQD
jgi:RNA polymerase sigma-70 factor (ECF subfamily)